MTVVLETLDEIALSLNPSPDKNSLGHGYSLVYDELFHPLRGQPLDLLEIGVWEGASLAMWRAYFGPDARITGADIDLGRVRAEWRDMAVLRKCDQSKSNDLIELATELGPFDIVIDDGSHLWHHQRETFAALWPYVKPGGWYVVEDVQTSYWREPPRGEGATFTEWAKSLVDEVNGRGKSAAARFENITPDELRAFTQYEREIRSVRFERYMVIVRKR